MVIKNDEFDLELSVIYQVFDDILECARRYYYYVVDKRNPVRYRLLDSDYDTEEIFIKQIHKELLSVYEVLPLLGCVVNSSTAFIEEFIDKLSVKYPIFTSDFATDFQFLLDESKVN